MVEICTDKSPARPSSLLQVVQGMQGILDGAIDEIKGHQFTLDLEDYDENDEDDEDNLSQMLEETYTN